ncbi:hypothetical protein [Dyadobacter psychrophilus]|nr:hypothetical protein [Dyadobacter psychrophilus]
MVLERHTGASPEAWSMCSIADVCSDLSFIHLPKSISTMQTSNGESVDSNKNSVNPTINARHASNVGDSLTQSQAEFWYVVECQGCKELAHSLKMVHDLALYHSDVPCDTAEKSALFDVNLLLEGFQRMGAKV